MKFLFNYFQSFSPAIYKFLVIIGLSFSLASCQWGDEVVALTQPNPDDFAALYTDTTSVKLSTVGTDSIMTGSSSRLFVGRFTDPYMGRMEATPYLQTAISSALSIANEAVYDSLVLYLKYDGYYYGDTTKAMNLSVHALQEDMLLKSVYYNDDFTPYDKAPIGQIKLFPEPRPSARALKKRVRIRLSDELGKKVFDMAKGNLITLNSDWINILKGVNILAASSDNSAVVGFARDSTSIKLHFHRPEVEGVTKDSTTIGLYASYNQVLADRSKTVLSKLSTNSRIALPSSESGEMTFIQNGSGIMTRVDLPSIRQFKYNKYTFANRAYLRVYPLQQSVTTSYFAPAALYAYLCDKNNSFYTDPTTGFPQALTSLAGAAVTAPLINDLVNNQQYYDIDVSQYAAGIIQSESEESAGILLRASAFGTQTTTYPDLNTEFSKSFDRLIIGSQNNPTDRGVKLNLYYTTVKTQ